MITCSKISTVPRWCNHRRADKFYNKILLPWSCFRSFKF